MVTRMRGGPMAKSKKPASTWHFSEGVLTVEDDGKIVVLGRYVTREWAAQAAAEHFARYGGQQA
jgi:hypothetical protein